MGPDRPFRVGLVCWVLILSGMYGVYSTMKVLNTDGYEQTLTVLPYSAGVAKTIFFGAMLAMIVGGICMYERQGWARWVYLAAMPFFFFQRFLVITTPPVPLTLDQADAQDPLYLQSHMAPLPNHTNAEIVLAILVALYGVSAWMLFTLRARRFFHPPMYIDE